MKKAKARATKGGSRAKKRSRRLPNVRLLLDGWAFAPLLLVVLVLLEAHVWLGALLAELHFQLGLSLVLAAAIAGFYRQWVRGAAWLSWGLLLLAPLWPLWRTVRQTPFHGGPTLRVAQCDVAGASLSSAQLASWLGQSRFDVVSATGIGSAQRKLLGQGAAGYTTNHGPKPGVLLFVRSALLPRQRPDGHVGLRVGHCNLDIAQLEVPSLISPSTAGARRAQLAPLLASDKQRRSLFIGTLGSRSAAQDLRGFMSQQGLRDVRLGHGRLATAPAALGPLGLPLDQILVRGWIAVAAADVDEPIVAGAHRTLHATLQLTEPRCR